MVAVRLLLGCSPTFVLVQGSHLVWLHHEGTYRSALQGQVSFLLPIGHNGHTYLEGSPYAFGTSLTRLFDGLWSSQLRENSWSINIQQKNTIRLDER